LSLLVGLPELLGQRWALAFGLPGIFALFLCLTLPFCAESPKFLLVVRGEKQKAKEALLRLVDKHQANAMFNELLMEVQNSKVS
jgi:hypothetical protein